MKKKFAGVITILLAVVMTVTFFPSAAYADPVVEDLGDESTTQLYPDDISFLDMPEDGAVGCNDTVTVCIPLGEISTGVHYINLGLYYLNDKGAWILADRNNLSTAVREEDVIEGIVNITYTPEELPFNCPGIYMIGNITAMEEEGNYDKPYTVYDFLDYTDDTQKEGTINDYYNELGLELDYELTGGMHDWGNGEIKSAATCTTSGTKLYTCSVCGATKTEVIPAKGHVTTAVPAKNASTTATGNKAHFKCTACGKLFADAAAKTELSAADVTIPKIIKIKGAKVTPKKTSVVWTGKALKPGVKSVVLDGVKLNTTDYSVVYTNNKNTGTAKITVKGKGGYTGTATATFKITKATQKVKSVSPAKKTVKAGASFKISGKLTKEQGTLQFKKVSGNSNITISSGGKVSVKKRTKSGKYTIKYKVMGKATKNCKATKYVTKKVAVTVK